MSVIVSKRKVSSMQFYKTARDLRRDITKMLEQMFSDESKFCYSRGYWKKLGWDPRKIDCLYKELFGGAV